MAVPTVVHAQGAMLDRILDATYPAFSHGLDRRASTTLAAAIRKTAWASRHRRLYALVEGAEVLASAEQHDLSGRIGPLPLHICGIGAVWSDPLHGSDDHLRELIERLVDDATGRRANLAVVYTASGSPLSALDGFEVIPTQDLELTVTESSRRGAPMTLIRDAEDRDLAAIVSMGQARSAAFRFHLERDVDFVKYAVTKKRLLAGLQPVGVRQLLFVIAEEGITAAAYAVISVVDDRWTIEECGDRDPSGARVGAILQALIAREPGEQRPVIRGWLPPGFVPPQVVIASTQPSAQVLLARPLAATMPRLGLSSDEVLYWRSDVP